MATLYLAVTHATETTRRRAINALRTNAIYVDAAWLDESGGIDLPTLISPPAGGVAADRPQPTGWLKWVAVVMSVCVVALLVAWVWTGDWRFGLTAAVLTPAAVIVLGLSITHGWEADQEIP